MLDLANEKSTEFVAVVGRRSVLLDGVRGLATVSVIFYHSILAMGPAPLTVLYPPVQSFASDRDILTRVVLTVVNGETAVLLFFILSGFVLSLSLQRESGSSTAVCTRFVVRRICRLFPAVMFCMAFCFAAAKLHMLLGLPASAHLQAAANPWLVLQNAFLVKIGIHGASWTLQVEVLAVPFILLVFFLQRAFGVIGLALSLAYALIALEHPALTFGLPLINITLYPFVIGMIVADKKMRAVFADTQPHFVTLLVAGFFLCRLFVPLLSTMATMAQATLAAVLVGVVHAGTQGAVLRLLGSPLVLYIGKISFSLYLMNIPVMWFVLLLLQPIGVKAPLEIGLIAGVLTTLIAIPLAAFSEKYFERGGIRLGHALARKIAPRGLG